jgi:hypothetical protein
MKLNPWMPWDWTYIIGDRGWGDRSELRPGAFAAFCRPASTAVFYLINWPTVALPCRIAWMVRTRWNRPQ